MTMRPCKSFRFCRRALRFVAGFVVVLAITVFSDSAIAQSASGIDTGGDGPNPVSLLRQAGDTLNVLSGGSGGGDDGGEDGAADEGSDLSAPLSIVVLLTILTVAPALLIMCTSFTRTVIVLALLRQALGTQSLPPSQVIVGLAMFITFLVMAPTFERVNDEAITPLSAGEISEFEAWERAKKPVRDFMFAQIEYADNWGDIHMILNYRKIKNDTPDERVKGDVDMLTLVPSFILSELKVAFLIGFRLYLPFLIIDMVIASVLMSMGMMMLPPILISLPFKLLLFVLVDGWRLVAGNLLNSFAVPGVTT